jgi:putative endonuclease
VYSEEFDTLGKARRRENQIKRWSRAKKEALIRGDLQSLKALAKRRQAQTESSLRPFDSPRHHLVMGRFIR